MPNHSIRCLPWLAIVLCCAAAASPPGRNAARERVDLAPVPLVGAPCEGCEAAFDSVPRELSSRLSLAAEDEAGERLVLSGRVLDRQGRGVEGIVIYLHQTDSRGSYSAGDSDAGPAARRHGRLRGWVRSAADGTFRVDTIRPGGYPGTDIPQHIHVQVIEPGCATYFIDDVMFRDDPRLTAEAERRLASGVGGDGVGSPRRVGGIWRVERDVVLGLGVSRYPPCGRG